MNIQDYFCTFVLDPKQKKSEPKAIKIRHPDFFFFFYPQNCLSLVSIKLKKKKPHQIEFFYSEKQPPSIEVNKSRNKATKL